MSCSRALILAAGRGTRMRAEAGDAALAPEQAAAAAGGHKAMMPIHGRPFLDYVLNGLADAGYTDIALVFAPMHDDARAYYRALRASRLRISLLVQAEPRGTADAVLAAEDWAGGGGFITLNSDNLYPVDVLARLREANGPAMPGFLRDSLGLSLDRLGAFALVEAGADGCLSRIVEKPGVAAMEAAGPDALISANVWRFDARIFEACRDVPTSPRGEKELPEAVGLSASRGVCFEIMRVRGSVIDVSRRSDVGPAGDRLRGVEVRL